MAIAPELRAIYYIMLLENRAINAFGKDIEAFRKVAEFTATIMKNIKDKTILPLGYPAVFDFDNYKYEYLKELVARL